MHTRAIECKGYEREDGLWDIEAHLTDTKTTVHTRHHGGRERQPGEPVHDMWLRVTIDLDMKIHDVEAKTDEGPYPVCGDITPNFKALAGLTIGPGWRKAHRRARRRRERLHAPGRAARPARHHRVPGHQPRARRRATPASRRRRSPTS